MATQAFPPTPAAPPPAGGGGAPNPVGTAVSQGQPQSAQLVSRIKMAMQDLMMLQRAVAGSKPEAAQKIQQGLQMIMEGFKAMSGGPASPTSPQGSVPPPPQVNQSPAAETPEAT